MPTSKSEIQAGLVEFTGTESYHRLSPLHGNLVCTDGVAWLCENAGCYWLIDAIASHQQQCRKDALLREIQFWCLQVHADNSATLTCERDSGDVALKEEIAFSDFPLDEISIYVAAGECGGRSVMVAMLTSEY